MTPAGVITTVVSFDYMNGYGAIPNGLAQGKDGNLYGTCQNGGTHFGASGGIVFRVTPADTQGPTVVAAPVFNPLPGTFSGSVTVYASTTTSGATIRYTTTGSEPTSTSAVFPVAGLKLTSTTAVKAKAFKSGMTDSTTTSGTYTAVLQQVVAPVLNPAPGTFSGSVTVHASTTTSGIEHRRYHL